MSLRTFTRATLLTAALAAGTACARVSSHSSLATPLSVPRDRAIAAPSELLLDAELSVQGCGLERRGISGFARMKVSDSFDSSMATELEYELWIENTERLPLSEAVIALSGVGTQPTARELTVVLWTGTTSDKARLRMRGIVALPAGVSTTELAAALRERRGALQVRVADQTGAAAGCGDLRN